MERTQTTLDFSNFRNYMTEKGINERFISVMTGISEKSLKRKLKGETEFNIKEIHLILHLFRALFEGNNAPDLADRLFYQAVKDI